MNCREFERAWNEVLDARSDGRSDLEATLRSHASSCEPCRAISRRYQILSQTVARWGPPPTPSMASAERLRALKVPRSRRSRFQLAVWLPLATAAGLLAVAWSAGLGLPGRFGVNRPLTVESTGIAVNSRPLEEAITEATDATLGLARVASAPAARIGREVFDYETIAPFASNEPSALIAPTINLSASGLLRTVGERVNAGVGPITGSARHAFSFLVPSAGPQSAPPEPRESL